MSVRVFSLVGLILSVVGAAEDLLSGYSLFEGQSSMPKVSGMMAPQIDTLSWRMWAIPLFLLGAAVLAAGILGISSIGMKRMQIFGALMILFGAIMTWIGYVMFYFVQSMFIGTMTLFGAGMLITGALMMINGIMMIYSSSRTRMMMP